MWRIYSLRRVITKGVKRWFVDKTGMVKEARKMLDRLDISFPWEPVSTLLEEQWQATAVSGVITLGRKIIIMD